MAGKILALDTKGQLELSSVAFLGQRIAVLGSSGMGKTNTVALLIEQLVSVMPFCIFDIHDEYWGLCEQFEFLRVGKSPNVQIQAGPEQAEQLAALSMERRLPVLVEMLYMTPEDRLQFVYNYCSKLWEMNRAAKQPYGVVLEEAQNFIPEGRASGDAMKLMKQFALEGRKFGFTIIISSQRSAEVSKTILGQCGMAFLHGVDILNDVQTYQGMLPYTMGETKKIALGLAVGQAIVKWRVGGKRGVKVAQMCPRQTFHVGDTPTFDGAAAPKLRQLNAKTIKELTKLVGDSEKADTQMVAESGAEIEALRQQVATLEADKALLETEVKMLQKQLTIVTEKAAAIPVAIPKQMALLKADTVQAGRLLVEETTTTTTRRVEASSEHRSSRAMTMAVNRQQRGFDRFITELTLLQPVHHRILALLMEDEQQAITVEVMCRRLDYSFSAARQACARLYRLGLLQKVSIYNYRAMVEHHLSEQYPDLDVGMMLEKVIAQIEE